MSYLTNEDIEKRLGSAAYVQLTDDDGNNQPGVVVVDEARLGAEGEVDSYLARRFAVPIDLARHPELGNLLKSITLDLAETRLRARRPPVPDETLRRHGDALAWLRGVADGTIALPSVAPISPSGLQGPAVLTSGEERVLSHDELSEH